ncbi:hypothetical protein B0J18DRAFT_116967 [Chaetomium sp. MPI-SDFR-AT-0129]|nr:hypothetical protein B0J18DRAFT_116967 [Chaetomium sp. MPI-SDFR-AT-0129]
MEFAVLAAEFGRAGTPFSGVQTVRGAWSQPSTWYLTPLQFISGPTLLRPPMSAPVLGGWFESIDSGIQESVFLQPGIHFRLTSKAARSSVTRRKMASLALPFVPGMSTAIARAGRPRHSTPDTRNLRHPTPNTQQHRYASTLPAAAAYRPQCRFRPAVHRKTATSLRRPDCETGRGPYG